MSLRILVVEDEHIIALDLQDVLEAAGHKVVGHATNMADALKLAKKAKPDVAVCDVDLVGEHNGLDTAEALGELYGMRVLFLTGRSDFLVRAMALPVEPLGYAKKPFVAAEVLGLLAEVA